MEIDEELPSAVIPSSIYDFDNLFSERQTFLDVFDFATAVPLPVLEAHNDTTQPCDTVKKQNSHNNKESDSQDQQSSLLQILTVPPDDPRRSYLATIFRLINRTHYVQLAEFLHENCLKDFVFEKKSNNRLDANGYYTMPNMPRYFSVSGVDAFVNMLAAMGECVPDRFYELADTIIRNRFDCSFVIGKFVLTGTVVFQLAANTAASGGDNSKTINNETANETKKSHSNFHDLTFTGQELKIEDDNVKFAPGNMFKDSAAPTPAIRYDGVATIYLNAEKKIRKLMFDYSPTRNENWVRIVKNDSIKRKRK